MGQLNVNMQDAGSEVVLNFAGQIDEDVDFSPYNIGGASSVTIDLDKVNGINSCGIREWIKWIKTASGAQQITFRNCPKIIVDQINMVMGFLPPNGIVESFYVPYYADDSGEEKFVLFQKGQEFNPGNVNPPPNVTDSTGAEMEIDIIEENYFKFILSAS